MFSYIRRVLVVCAVNSQALTGHGYFCVRVSDMFQKVTDVVEAFAPGEIVIVTDDDDRENEGDLIVSASS